MTRACCCYYRMSGILAAALLIGVAVPLVIFAKVHAGVMLASVLAAWVVHGICP
jgi:hypothetical protein